MFVPFGAWLPDRPSLGNEGALVVKNVIPALKSYRSVSDLSAYSSNALTARAQGAAAYLDRDGNVNLFAGDASKLYQLTAGATTFSDISKTGGYTTAADERWSFTQFNNYVLAANFADPIQLFDLTASSAFEDAITSGETTIKCRYLASSAKGFVFMGNTTDGTDGARPNRIWWAKQGDPRTVPTAGTSAAIAAQSDFQDLTGDSGSGGYGWIMGLATGLTGGDVAVFMERALVRGLYVGGAVIFSFDAVEGARGTPAAGSLIQLGGVVFYLGEDGFYAFDGMSARPIGADKVDKFFFSDSTFGLDQNYFHRISGIADPINKIVMWAYPSVSGSGGVCDTVIAYNWTTGNWSLIPGLQDIEIFFSALAPGYSLDTLDTLSSSIDALAYSLDSRQLTGGARLIGAFGTDHTLYTFTGSALAATVTTAEFEPVPGQRSMVTEAWPMVEGTSATITLTPITRNRQNDAVTTGTAVSQNSTGFCPLRTNSRYIRAQLDVAAGGSWSHITGLEIPDDKVTAAGRR